MVGAGHMSYRVETKHNIRECNGQPYIPESGYFRENEAVAPCTRANVYCEKDSRVLLPRYRFETAVWL